MRKFLADVLADVRERAPHALAAAVGVAALMAYGPTALALVQTGLGAASSADR